MLFLNRLSFFWICLFLLNPLLAQESQMMFNHKEQSYQLELLAINSEYSEYGVDYLSDKMVIYSGPSKETLRSSKKTPYIYMYQGYLTKDGRIVGEDKFSMEIESDFHEAKFTFTKDGKYVYFMNGSQNKGKGIRVDKHIQLYGADVVKGVLVNITLLEINDTVSSSGYPFLTDDDKTLYFASNRYGGKGGMDLYKVPVLGNNSFGAVTNLGYKVNTPNDEIYPFIDVDGVLYFSSDRVETRGGLDVFGIYLEDDLNDVYQLPFPINSENDDFGFVISASSNHGFLSSNRDGGKGNDDIYAVTLSNLQSIVGNVLNSDTSESLSDVAICVYKNGVMVDSLNTNSNGFFRTFLKVDNGEEYQVKAVKNNFLIDSLSLSPSNIRYHSNEVVFNLSEDIKINKVESLIPDIEPIYFDAGKVDIRKDAALSLDKVVVIMNKYPEIVVELRSHTDNKGDKTENEKLSVKRAMVAVDYIISKDISSFRLRLVGYGDSRPLNNCADNLTCTDKENQLNRRIEFVILKE